MAGSRYGEMFKMLTPKKQKTLPLKAWRGVFLEALRDSGNVRFATQKSGVSRQAAYQAKKRSSDFSEAWDLAIADAVDLLEATAWSRGRATSDTLLIFLLKAHRPEKYRDPVKKNTAEAELRQGEGGQQTTVFRFEYSEDAEE